MNVCCFGAALVASRWKLWARNFQLHLSTDVEHDGGKVANAVFQVFGMARSGIEPSLPTTEARAQRSVPSSPVFPNLFRLAAPYRKKIICGTRWRNIESCFEVWWHFENGSFSQWLWDRIWYSCHHYPLFDTFNDVYVYVLSTMPQKRDMLVPAQNLQRFEKQRVLELVL